jgi:hypothetical protein
MYFAPSSSAITAEESGYRTGTAAGYNYNEQYTTLITPFQVKELSNAEVPT